jgi:predicted RNA-binding protein YlqC (UPF0109 family)
MRHVQASDLGDVVGRHAGRDAKAVRRGFSLHG